jgi:hypothetical protein
MIALMAVASPDGKTRLLGRSFWSGNKTNSRTVRLKLQDVVLLKKKQPRKLDCFWFDFLLF